MYSNKENINILTALLVKNRVQHIVVCPGSRNAPLVHNFNECPDIVCHPVTDERSAGFMALGMTQQLNAPVAVCVTSGSALLNVLPAAAEATYQHTGIIVISADRPAAWIDQLDGQTCPQPGALGQFVAKSVSLPEPHNGEERWHCNRLVNEAFMAYYQPERPSIHINVPISEPLFEFNVKELPDERIVHGWSWDDDMAKDYVIRLLAKAKRPMFVIGQTKEDEFPDDCLYDLAETFVVLSEPISGGELPRSFTDQMLYAISKHPADYKPDMVVFMGGHTISKRLRIFLRSLDKDVMQIVISPDMQLRDISTNTSFVIKGDAGNVVRDINGYLNHDAGPSAFYNKWQKLREDIARRHEAYQPAYSQMLAVKLFEKEYRECDDYGKVYYANSMSVRLAALYACHYCGCNRGLNGIEGSLSVAAGASLVVKENVYCIIGDLSFFYDENALWQQQLGGNFRILLLNNSQGGIFRNLKGLEQSRVRDTLVSARHGTSAEGLCQQFNVKYLRADDEMSLERGITELVNMNSHRPVLLEVITDIDTDEQQFKKYYEIMRND